MWSYSSLANGIATWMAALSMAGTGAVAAGTGIATTQPVAAYQAPVQCMMTLTRNLSYGSRDGAGVGQVSALQNFLISQGVLSASATGYFGPLTLGAVKQFQARNGIPSTGFVGPLTRAALARLGCGTTPPQSNVTIYSMIPTYGPTGTQVSITGFGFTNDNTILFGNGAIVHVPISSSRAIACTTDPSCHGGINQTLIFSVPSVLYPLCYYSGCMQPSWQTTPGSYSVSVMNSNGTSNAMTFTVTSSSTASPSISSIWPTSGQSGTQVTLSGSGFNSNDVVLIGSGAIRYPSISNNGTQLTFTLPDGVGPYCAPGMMCPMYLQLLTPGTYQISVKDESSGSVSNSIAFTVTSGSSTAPGLSITGLDAPATLSVGSVGSWTVHTTLTSGSSTNLHYSVVWGDQNSVNSAQFVQPTGATTQTSSTFTHAYQATGTYTPIFTVSNDSGQSLNVSASVTVTPLY